MNLSSSSLQFFAAVLAAVGFFLDLISPPCLSVSLLQLVFCMVTENFITFFSLQQHQQSVI